MDMTQLKGETLLQVLNQVRSETKHDLCHFFNLRLQQIGSYILIQQLSPSEANDLLCQEAEKLRYQNYETEA